MGVLTGGTCVETSGSALVLDGVKGLQDLLSKVKPGGVLFIDEVSINNSFKY